MNILFTASEGVPFCKTGGLADVVGALPEVLAGRRHNVRLFLPLYREIREHFPDLKPVGAPFVVPVADSTESVRLFEKEINNRFHAVFLDIPTCFDRAGLYGPRASEDYPDNDRRFAVFSRAVFEAAKSLNFRPDIIHAHDWQTGLVPAYLRLVYNHDPFFKRTAAVFTIHNMVYQGTFPPGAFHWTGLPASFYSPRGLEFYGKVSYLKAGLLEADELNTVSPTYAEETRTDVHKGSGLEGVLVSRGAHYRGILNGLDTKAWDPAKDVHLVKRFNSRQLAGRLACKRDLQTWAHFAVGDDIPLAGFIGRLDYQKGLDLLMSLMPTLLSYGLQFVVLGQGRPDYMDGLRQLQQKHPRQVFVENKFAEPLAHKIYAGVDLFFMPSRYEPCGLGQLIAMRYGAVPVVTPTGGLKDTVKNTTSRSVGTGFVARDNSPEGYLTAVLNAMATLKDGPGWNSLQRRGMMADHSWKTSASAYLALYESALAQRPR